MGQKWVNPADPAPLSFKTRGGGGGEGGGGPGGGVAYKDPARPPPRVERAHFWGLCVTGSTAAFLARRAAKVQSGGAETTGAVETDDGGRCGVHAENFAYGTWDVERRGRGRGGTEDGEACACEDTIEAHENRNQGMDGEREGRAKRGSYPGGERNKHASGPTAVTEGGGGAKSYLEDSLECIGGQDRTTLVWVQGPEGWCQRHARGYGRPESQGDGDLGGAGDMWWLLRGG